MLKHLITGGCSFSHYSDEDSWITNLTNWLKIYNPNLTYEHTGYRSQGQEMIQKKVTLAITDALQSGIKEDEIIVVVMWSGTYRKAWYIDNKDIIKEMVKGWPNFQGGMTSQFLDLKNNQVKYPNYFKTKSGDFFDYNPEGGWYFTVDGSDCKLDFVQQYYLLDGYYGGVGKTHSSLENIIMLQNFCKLHNIKFFQQFFMDFVYQDIEQNKNHQIINYLYKQLDFNNIITEGMFEYIHTLLGIPRHEVKNITYEERKKLNEGKLYFSNDGFHPGKLGVSNWCDNILFPFLKNKV